MRVLVVSSEALLRETVGGYLEDAAITPIVVSGVTAAREMLSVVKFDLVCIDANNNSNAAMVVRRLQPNAVLWIFAEDILAVDASQPDRIFITPVLEEVFRVQLGAIIPEKVELLRA